MPKVYRLVVINNRPAANLSVVSDMYIFMEYIHLYIKKSHRVNLIAL